MRAAWFHDLLLMGRTPSLVYAALLHVAAAAGFVVAWSGVAAAPIWPGMNLYEQHRAIQRGLLSVIVPWGVCRLVGEERGSAYARLGVLAGVAPLQILAGRLLALATYVVLLVATAFPLALLAQQMSAVRFPIAAADAAWLCLFGTAAAGLTLTVALRVRDRLTGWLIATAAILAIHAAVSWWIADVPALAVWVIGVCGLGVLFVLLERLSRSLWYVKEPVQ